MSFKGEIEAQCPKGCEPFTTEVWSFIQGDRSPELRLAVLFRECNLILCPACEAAFIPPQPYIYFEPRAELLAFVFAESFREKAEFWRRKMHDDFLVMKKSFGAAMPLDVEPEIFFGTEELALLLEGEDYRGEEREVMEHVALELGLKLYRVSPRYARQNQVPATLPYAAADGAAPTRAAVVKGLEKLLAANDRLTAFADYLKRLQASRGAALPPPSTLKPA